MCKSTHVLASPRKRIFLRSQRSINPNQVVKAKLANSYGIAPKASVGLMPRRVGGLDNLGFIPKDYNYYLSTRWTYDVGKFRPRLIKLTSFKPKLLIRFIMNKTCQNKQTSISCQNHAAEK